jgi:hypothetical protein
MDSLQVTNSLLIIGLFLAILIYSRLGEIEKEVESFRLQWKDEAENGKKYDKYRD